MAEANSHLRRARAGKLAAFLRDNKVLTIGLDVLTGGLYAGAGVLVAVNLWLAVVALVVAVALNVLARLRTSRHETKVTELDKLVAVASRDLIDAQAETEVARETVRELQQEIGITVESVLQRVAMKFDLGNKDRITLYLYSRGEETLRIIGRHSKDAGFKVIAPETKQTRYKYTSGLVGFAARKETRLQPKNGPSFDTHPDQYRQWQRDNYLSVGELPRMKSRCYDVIPIFESSDHQQVLGIIALESTKTRSAQITEAGDSMAKHEDVMTVGILRESLRLYATAVLNAGREEQR